MAYNLKEDWNQFKKVTTQLVNENRYAETVLRFIRILYPCL